MHFWHCSAPLLNYSIVLPSLHFCFRGSRVRLHNFLTGLVHVFSTSKCANVAVQIFFADNLTQFSYERIREPLFVIHLLDGIVAMESVQLRKDFVQNLNDLGVAFDDESDDLDVVLGTVKNSESV